MHKIKIQFILLNYANCCLLVILYNINAGNYYSSIDIVSIFLYKNNNYILYSSYN